MTLAKRSVEAVVATLFLALAGCGTPGPPQPPSLNLPDRVDNLAAVRAGSQVTLTWTMPKRNTDRLPLKRDVAVKVCRNEAANQCSPVVRLTFAPGSTGSFIDSLPTSLTSGLPRSLSYIVELENPNGRSAGASNAAIILAGEAPAPVAGLAAEARKGGTVLRWISGDPHTAVRIHRKLLTPHPTPERAGSLPTPAEPINQDLFVVSDAGVALDKTIAFGNTYEYRAQRLARTEVDGHTVELAGEISPPIRVEAQDVFPPARPKGLAAVATAASEGTPATIDLNWEPNTEPDLAGYFVYRREDDTMAWTNVSGKDPVVGGAFHDVDVAAGHTYRYAVSAVDQAGHESIRSDEARDKVPNP